MSNFEKKHFISRRLESVLLNTSETSGFVLGFEENDEIFCIAAVSCRDIFLSGISIIGIFCHLNAESPEKELISNISKCLDTLKVELENPIVLFIDKVNNDSILISKIFSTYHKTLSNVSISYLSNCKVPAHLLRTRGKFPLIFENSSDANILEENIMVAIERLKTTVKNHMLSFLLNNSNYILNSSKREEGVVYGNLCNYQDPELAKRNKGDLKKQRPMEFKILKQITGDKAIENTVNCSLFIHSQRRESCCISLHLPVDVLLICQESSSTFDIYNLLIDGILRQLEKMSMCLRSYAKKSEFICPVPYHFYPGTCEIPVTVIYPLNKTDEDLEEYRKFLHRVLLLPTDRPILRKLNKYDFETSCPYLINPHEGLSPSAAIGGKTSIVQGKYSYHHYMQDRINDDGWGCAYRSLQTIISWFKFQGYTDRSIPTHLEIQQALVDVGDKTQNFIGSKKWIGSQEVAFVLNHLIQVQSKIVHVNSGSEMSNKGRELFLHFKDQGTPVMIGGGLLAHTILGVNFNESTGDLEFLILDPHYTGGEDLRIIQNKGWCSWEDATFWNPNAFYNLCLPQRPMLI